MKGLRFDSFQAFEAYMDNGGYEADDYNIGYAVKNHNNTTYDMETRCKSSKTALRRLAKVFPELSWITDCINSDEDYIIPGTEGGRLLADCDSYTVENIDGDIWYVSARMYD